MLEADPVRQLAQLRGPARLTEVVFVDVEGGHRRAAARELEGVEARVASDVEHGLAAEIVGKVRGEQLPVLAREVAERVVGAGLEAAGQMQVVKPGA